MNCPKCGAEMWMCGTFGVIWNCECGHSEMGTDEQQKALDEFVNAYRQRLDARDPADIKIGERLRAARMLRRIYMRDVARKLGCSSAQISRWEMGLDKMTTEQINKFYHAIGWK